MNKRYLFISIVLLILLITITTFYLHISHPFKRFYEKNILTPYLITGILDEEEFIEIIAQRQTLIETYGKKSPEEISLEIEKLYRYFGTSSKEIIDFNAKYKDRPKTAYLIAKKIKTRINEIKVENNLR